MVHSSILTQKGMTGLQLSRNVQRYL